MRRNFELLIEGLQVPVWRVIRDVVEQLLGEEGLVNVPIIDIEKMHAYELAFLEMIFRIPLHLFEHIGLCKSEKEI